MWKITRPRYPKRLVRGCGGGVDEPEVSGRDTPERGGGVPAAHKLLRGTARCYRGGLKYILGMDSDGYRFVISLRSSRLNSTNDSSREVRVDQLKGRERPRPRQVLNCDYAAEVRVGDGEEFGLTRTGIDHSPIWSSLAVVRDRDLVVHCPAPSQPAGIKDRLFSPSPRHSRYLARRE